MDALMQMGFTRDVALMGLVSELWNYERAEEYLLDWPEEREPVVPEIPVEQAPPSFHVELVGLKEQGTQTEGEEYKFWDNFGTRALLRASGVVLVGWILGLYATKLG